MQSRTNHNNSSSNNQLRINYWITAPQVRLLLADGTMHGVVTITEALKLAKEAGLDLIEINPKATPYPIAKIADHGKFMYEQQKQEKAAKKKQKSSELRTLECHPTTQENDLQHKLAKAKEFLTEGDKVRFVVKFRGREMTHLALGEEKLKWFLDALQDMIATPPPILMEGRDMSVIVVPKANK